jgi:hypothetical protein
VLETRGREQGESVQGARLVQITFPPKQWLNRMRSYLFAVDQGQQQNFVTGLTRTIRSVEALVRSIMLCWPQRPSKPMKYGITYNNAEKPLKRPMETQEDCERSQNPGPPHKRRLICAHRPRPVLVHRFFAGTENSEPFG